MHPTILIGPICRLGPAVAVASGLAALSVLMLPVLLALLMVLFDSTAQGLLVLLGTLAGLVERLFADATGTLPAYRTIALDPWGLELHALLRASPCAVGLAIIFAWPGAVWRWWGTGASWAIAAWSGDALVRWALAPGLGIAVAFGIAATIDRLRRPVSARPRRNDRGR